MMTGIDTNILIRYLTEDDQEQFLRALQLLNRKGGKFFVADLVLIELDWMLTEVYGWTKDEIVETLARLLTIHSIVVESESRILRALKAMRKGADLSDELIVDASIRGGCEDFATFDKGVLKRHKKHAFAP